VNQRRNAIQSRAALEVLSQGLAVCDSRRTQRWDERTLVGMWYDARTDRYFDACLAFAITIAALVYLCLCNGGTRGAHFLYRYFPLSVVVGWKVVVASLVALPVAKVLLSGVSPWSSPHDTST
jgi:hypothetical protein